MDVINKKEVIALKRGYLVSEDGKFYNPQGRLLQHANNNGYIAVNIRINGKAVQVQAHRIQAYSKYGDSLYDKGIEVRHLNGDCKDNSWSNIAIGTHSDNMLDIPPFIRLKKALHATSFRKVKHDKLAIIDFYNKTKSYTKTMREFNISSKGTLHYILNSNIY